ncbi:MAG TPA: hypothetical protein VJQ45_12585 [Ktedonobacterales bacterium]|nr:hypothetical protein [Ktedonobacterales bacterium]
MAVMEPATARRAGGGQRFLLGVALGLIPILLMLLFGFTSCPVVGMADGYRCSDPNQDIGSWFFVFAVAIYGVEALAMLVCLFIRPARLVALGMLAPLLAGPFVGVLGFEMIAIARHPLSLAGGWSWLAR